MHVHVYHDEGEAKYWLEPALELAASTGLSQRRLGKVRRLIEENEDAIRKAWTRHFGR
jgi:hypothetical protein